MKIISDVINAGNEINPLSLKYTIKMAIFPLIIKKERRK